ncbi:transcriptional regulator [Neorhizobium sp. SOG26]|uniref:DJ-1/PfpI family protein n=1 Tax=Neorhizobium sp. SOG26 TaxID=2060726 RepID=UPI000E570A32|nr:DJ-1/PfpI family protein [Neorhizobium sp. SOG26]AXV14508.1 transcriptional regulator [Neorhizobium sp. SOG26]
MTMRYLFWGIILLMLLCFAGFGGWLLSLPTGAPATEAPQVPEAERQAMLEALRPPDGRRPVVAVIGINDATETTDYLVPTGILRRADVADVLLVSTDPGPVRLYPALQVEADQTMATFDAEHPDGADYVIVPAMSRDDDPQVLGWLRAQAEKGARIIAVCAGAKVLGATGLLDNRRATTHWYYLRDLLQRSPGIDYVPDRRMVSDGAVTTTTGISASMPMMLTLIEAIAGRQKAEEVAAGLGVPSWDARHLSAAFGITRRFATTVLANRLAFWDSEEFVLQIKDGVDEVSLALAADAWSRSYRSSVEIQSASGEAVVSANGIRILPDPDRAHVGQDLLSVEGPPARVLDQTLEDIASRYGLPTAHVVAMQLECPWAKGAP